ncbi:uncharacterized protein LOC126586715 isoform X2 [Malus sylvestris]|uniref:uncharacterized protein LOC126586715 isoform X2 n=1 Tax=Malus sylvestris TaxID=3752 RepID=UPI0021AC24A1|nr:uncharacterized protein LOC126586715 isoform X2 [Malus sylvestris]
MILSLIRNPNPNPATNTQIVRKPSSLHLSLQSLVLVLFGGFDSLMSWKASCLDWHFSVILGHLGVLSQLAPEANKSPPTENTLSKELSAGYYYTMLLLDRY